MKIAITGDFHFGFNGDAAEQARRVMLDGKGKADFVIAAGDLFDYRVPKPETIHESIVVFNAARHYGDGSTIVTVAEGERTAPAGTSIIAIYGTHERRTKGLVNVIELLHEAGLIVNCHARKAFVGKSKSGREERVCVQGMGGIPEELAKRALELMEFRPEPGCFNIFVFHQSLSELIPADAEMLSMRDLPAGFDLYVDGHIHWRHDIKEAGKHLLIPGSTVVTQMKKNEAEPKGYYLYDTDKRAAEFIIVPTRPFVYDEVALEESGLADATAMVRACAESCVSRAPVGSNPLVKIKVGGSLAKGLSPSNLDLAPVLREYSGRCQLSIDKQLGHAGLKEKIDMLRRIRDERKSARELGMELLKRKLDESGATAAVPPGFAEELFDTLSAGEVDAAVGKLTAP